MSVRTIAFVLMLLTVGCKGWLDINDADRDTLLGGLEKNVGELTKRIDDLQATLDTQREKLATDVEQIVALTIANLRNLTDQLQQSLDGMRVSVTNFQETMTAELGRAIAGFGETVEKLRAGVASDVAATIRQLSAEIELQRVGLLRHTQEVVQSTIRPTLERLSREGDYFVGKITLQANVLLVRIIGGVLSIIALIGIVIALVKLREPSRRWPAVGMIVFVLLGSTLSATVLASPIAGIGAPVLKIPSGSRACAEMSAVHERFLATKTRELANQLKTHAVECIVVAPTSDLARQAEAAFREASRYRGEAIPCTTSAGCATGEQCDPMTGECLGPGIYCTEPSQCRSDQQCVNRRCTQGSGACTSAAQCHPDQTCDRNTGRCVLTANITPARCEVTGQFGLCRDGKTASVERLLVCQQVTQPVAEQCDGLDNNCNNTVDDGLQSSERCIAPNQRGECANGQKACGGSAGWQCSPAQPRQEASLGCNGKDDDCDGAIDNGVPDGQPCTRGVGECAKTAKQRCVAGAMQCIPGEPSAERCDGLDNDCDRNADPQGTCPEVVVRQQSPSDNSNEMTWSPRLPTDLIDGFRTHGGPCGEDDHGRPYLRTRAEVSATSSNGAICELSGPHGGFVSEDPRDCRIQVHYKTRRMGSNVWCSGTWWAAPYGAYRR